MARDRLPRSLALALLVLLAGCAGLVGDDRSDRETVSPAPVPTYTEPLPPGVSAVSVSAAVLADAHERALRQTNYTIVIRQRIVDGNETLRTTTRTRAVAAGAERYAGRLDRTVVDFPLTTLPVTLEYWTNGSVYASRRLDDGSRFVYGWSRNGGHTVDVDESDVLGKLVRAVDVSVAERGEEVVLAGSTLSDPGQLPIPPYMTGPHDVSLTLVVDGDGVVTRWRLAYDAWVGNRSVRVVRETRVTDVGTTTVDPPDWVGTAREWVSENSGG